MTAAPDLPGPWPHTTVYGRVLALDGDRFEVTLPTGWAEYIDPRLRETLAPWGLAAPEVVPRWRRWKREGGRVLAVSFDHSWALPAWARAPRTAGAPLTVVHLDRHTDCGAPLLLLDAGGALSDCLTGAPVDVDAPASLEDAVASGAIGIGGFIAPAVAAGLVGEVVHVFPGRTPLPARRERELVVGAGEPHPRRPELRWLSAGLDGEPGPAVTHRRVPYRVAHAAALPRDLAGPVALDVDLDYASNRLRGEPDWEDAPGPELTEVELAVDLHAVLDALDPRRVACVTVGTSPRFCPSERWRPLIEAVSAVLAERLGPSLAGLGPWEPAPGAP